ncbi:MAG: virginiamycin lyase [Thermoleophilaceae bacterium]|nr:virginiamycin lyase [Thermoleophilaceae bacterium]
MRKLLALALVLGLAAAAAIAETPSKGLPTNCVTYYKAGVTGHPGTLFTTGDGGIWFTEVREDRIGRFDIGSKRAKEFQLPPMSGPRAIARDPKDPNQIWFAGITDRIGHFDLRSGKTQFFMKGLTPGGVPHAIVVGSDGDVYWTEQQKPLFDYLDPRTGKVTELTKGPDGVTLHGLAADPDGQHLWATRQDADQLIRFNIKTKSFDKTVQLPKGAGPHSLILGPDKHTLWIAFQHSSQLGSYDISTGQVKAFDTPLKAQNTPDPQPAPKILDLEVGPGGKSIYFTTFFANRLFRFDIAKQKLSEPNCPIRPGGSSLGLVHGPDNKIWFSSALSGEIDRVNDTR